MFVLNLIFVHQSSLHPKYKQLCINGPFWAQELGRYIFYCDVLNLTFVYKTSLHPKHKRFILWALWAQGCGVYIFHCDLLNQLFLHQTSLHQKQERLCLWALWLEGTFSTVFRGGDFWVWVLEAIPKIVHVRWSFAIFARARWWAESGRHKLRGILTSWLDPEFYPQSAYVGIFATFANKML